MYSSIFNGFCFNKTIKELVMIGHIAFFIFLFILLAIFTFSKVAGNNNKDEQKFNKDK